MLDTSTPFDSTMPQPAPMPEPDPARPTRAGASALAPGTLLGEFEIVRVIGSGGFGIVYLANDRLLLRQVAIKEYLPATLAGRGRGQTVVVHHQSAAKSFAAGLASFLNEAQLLARFDHPALVKVYRFWRANDTAYMAMPYYLGRTLKDERLAMRAAPSEAWLRALAEPLLSALDLLHGQGVFHRDISPDNIMIRPDGRPVLLDFGSARHAIGDRTRMLTVLLKPNFAPVEQYGDDTTVRQGAWTDLYALGATLRFALTGQAPTPSVIRAVRDELAPLASASLAPQAGTPAVSPLFLAAIDWALTVAPQGRPQDVASLRQVMRGEATAPARRAANEAPMRSRRGLPVVAILAGGLVALALAAAAGWVASRDRAVTTRAAVAPPAPTPTTAIVAPAALTPTTAIAAPPAPATATRPPRRSRRSPLRRRRAKRRGPRSQDRLRRRHRQQRLARRRARDAPKRRAPSKAPPRRRHDRSRPRARRPPPQPPQPQASRRAARTISTRARSSASSPARCASPANARGRRRKRMRDAPSGAVATTNGCAARSNEAATRRRIAFRRHAEVDV